MIDLVFTSRLPVEFREELETLLFFHPRQTTFYPDIVGSVERYGSPNIAEDGGFLRLRVGESSDIQSLYAVANSGDQRQLLGVMVYLRIDVETILLLHMAVKEQYCSAGNHSDELLTLRLISELRGIARRLKGVRSILVTYGGHPAHQKIPVRAISG